MQVKNIVLIKLGRDSIHTLKKVLAFNINITSSLYIYIHNIF